MSTTPARLAAEIESWQLRYFTPAELLFLGENHHNPESAAYGKNSLPPTLKLLRQLRPTAEVLDQLRHQVDRPMTTNSVYRNTAYNRLVGGAPQSRHLRCEAVDVRLLVYTWAGHKRLMRLAVEARHQGLWRGGLGLYRTFIHLDVGSRNRNFGPCWLDV